tara:strand:+ start:655 stop:1059 length:405 start_codon:yes stop_codon:yes gene_type:complete
LTDATKFSWITNRSKNTPKRKIINNTDSFIAIPVTSEESRAVGCHHLGSLRNPKSAATKTVVARRKNISSLPNLEKYNMLGLMRRRLLAEIVPTGPKCFRQCQGKPKSKIPDKAANSRAVKSDSPNSQKKPAVI